MSTSDIPISTIPNDDDYNEDEDDDFNPDVAPADVDAVSSDSEDEEASGVKRKRSAKTVVDVDFDNSGDEATISKGKKKRKKGDDAINDDDEGGEGGLIKTRAQRRVEEKEKKALATSKGSSVDVNALWAQMAAVKDTKGTDALEVTNTSLTPQVKSVSSGHNHLDKAPTFTSTSTTSHNKEPTVMIKRTYDFAGQTMTEEKTVSASSAEAKLYFAEQARKEQEALASSSKSSAPKPGLNRPKKKASIFGNKSTASEESKGPKLTTLEKSKLDWAAHVDQEGIVNELEEHSKAKDTYLGRLDFLGRMDMKREDELKEKRAKK